MVRLETAPTVVGARGFENLMRFGNRTYRGWVKPDRRVEN